MIPKPSIAGLITIALAGAIAPATAADNLGDHFISDVKEVGACFEDISSLMKIEHEDDGKVAETVMVSAHFLFMYALAISVPPLINMNCSI